MLLSIFLQSSIFVMNSSYLRMNKDMWQLSRHYARIVFKTAHSVKWNCVQNCPLYEMYLIGYNKNFGTWFYRNLDAADCRYTGRYSVLILLSKLIAMTLCGPTTEKSTILNVHRKQNLYINAYPYSLPSIIKVTVVHIRYGMD
jgi:hypothetical protein